MLDTQLKGPPWRRSHSNLNQRANHHSVQPAARVHGYKRSKGSTQALRPSPIERLTAHATATYAAQATPSIKASAATTIVLPIRATVKTPTKTPIKRRANIDSAASKAALRATGPIAQTTTQAMHKMPSAASNKNSSALSAKPAIQAVN